MGAEYEDMGFVQRSFDFWMPLSSCGNCQFGTQHVESQEPHGGVTYLGDANDSVV